MDYEPGSSYLIGLPEPICLSPRRLCSWRAAGGGHLRREKVTARTRNRGRSRIAMVSAGPPKLFRVSCAAHGKHVASKVWNPNMIICDAHQSHSLPCFASLAL